jgi:hypothetical protein
VRNRGERRDRDHEEDDEKWQQCEVIRVDDQIPFLIAAAARDMQRSTELRLKLWFGGQIYPNGTRN